MQIEEYPTEMYLDWDRSVMTVDPGGTTGVNTLVEGVVKCFQLESHGRADEVSVAQWIVSRYVDSGIDLLVMEDFVLEPNAAPGGRAGLSAERVMASVVAIGVERGVLDASSVRFQLRTVKGQIDDGRLARRGLLCKPKTKWRHVNDTNRHLVQAMRSLRV